MIVLPVDSTPASLEDFLRDTRAGPGQALRMPIKVDRGGAFGFSALAVQSILTWARIHGGPRVLQVSPSYAGDEATRSRFAGSLPGMVALYFSDEISAGNLVLEKREALQEVAPYVSAMQEMRYRETVRGPGALLCCFQGARNEFLNALYSRRQRGSSSMSSLQDGSSLTKVIRDMLDSAQSGLSTRFTEDQIAVICNLIFQLFNNADIHTIDDAIGTKYSTGVRGIQIRIHSYTELSELTEYFAGDAKLAHYMRKVVIQSSDIDKSKPPRSNRRMSAFVELSIFDSGPGLALRWLSAKHGIEKYSEMSINQELEGVIQCFQLHSTTQGPGYVGDGLAIALKAMRNLKAFMALRTGRLSLIQDFSSKEHTSFNPEHRFTKRKLLSQIEGASYTISFPVPK